MVHKVKRIENYGRDNHLLVFVRETRTSGGAGAVYSVIWHSVSISVASHLLANDRLS